MKPFVAIGGGVGQSFFFKIPLHSVDDCAKTEIAYDSYEPPFEVVPGPGTTSYGSYAISDLAQSSTEQEVLDKDITKRLFMRILEGTMIWYKQSAP